MEFSLRFAIATPIRGITENLPTGFYSPCAIAPIAESNNIITIAMFFFIIFFLELTLYTLLYINKLKNRKNIASIIYKKQLLKLI